MVPIGGAWNKAEIYDLVLWGYPFTKEDGRFDPIRRLT